MSGHRPLAHDPKPFSPSPHLTPPSWPAVSSEHPNRARSICFHIAEPAAKPGHLPLLGPVPLPNRIISPALCASVEAWTDMGLTVTENREDCDETGIIRVLMQNQQSVGSLPFLPPVPSQPAPPGAGCRLSTNLSAHRGL